MNIGYGSNSTLNWICPICGKNIYGNKLGNDYECVNENCVLNGGAKAILNLLQKDLDLYNKYND